MGNPIDRFNVRVYILLLHPDGKHILVSDEIIQGRYYTKFPGGGLEFGESTVDCVVREAEEELKQPLRNIRHFFTADVFIRSMFRTSDQVIPIYYSAEPDGILHFPTTTERFSFTHWVENEESFRWVLMDTLDPSEFELPGDRLVAEMIRSGVRPHH